jgi:Na+/melibiose symporter-like transporter
MFLKDLFVKAIPAVANTASTIFKEQNGKVSSKRVFSVLGGGSLITMGLGIIDKGIESGNDKVLYVGLGLVALGVAAGYLAAFNIKEISKDK